MRERDRVCAKEDPEVRIGIEELLEAGTPRRCLALECWGRPPTGGSWVTL